MRLVFLGESCVDIIKIKGLVPSPHDMELANDHFSLVFLYHLTEFFAI